MLLAAVGDANDAAVWSGIPYHLLQAGQAAGIIDSGLSLSVATSAVAFRRIVWNSLRLLTGDRPGGFQYSSSFLEKIWDEVEIEAATIINCFQLYPHSLVQNGNVDKWFFIDQTLTQLFEYYGERARVGLWIAKVAVQQERLGYQAARGIIVNSGWARESVVDDYGIEPSKVHVVVPGPSLSPPVAASASDSSHYRDHPLRLVFVGTEWYRKGLDRLLRALDHVRERGIDMTLCVIGCRRESIPSELQDVGGVEWAGFVDKWRDEERFVQLLHGCHVGCLLSREEAGGIALREFHAVGLPVIASQTGGVPEHVIPEAAILVPTEESPEAIANRLIEMHWNRDSVWKLAIEARHRRESVMWPAAVRKMSVLLA